MFERTIVLGDLFTYIYSVTPSKLEECVGSVENRICHI